jgi:uncharacterized protein (DUF433 family)
MSDRELNGLLWRSFYLGMRSALDSSSNPSSGAVSLEKIQECVRVLDEVARNTVTLHEPRYDPSGLDAETNRVIQGIQNRVIVADRDLAALIVAGLNQAATVPEGPSPTLPIDLTRPPLRVDEGGAVRIGQSRIGLDTIIEQYENGMTPEEMVSAYDTLRLADIHAVIAYYLRHREAVRDYSIQRRAEAEALRAKLEDERPRITRAELLARRMAGGKDHAPAGK